MITLEQAIRYCSDLGLIVQFEARSVMLYQDFRELEDGTPISGDCGSLEDAVEKAAQIRGDTDWL